MKQLKDYLHFHLGCDVYQGDVKYKLVGLMPYKALTKNPADEIRIIALTEENQYDEFPLDEHVKIALRHLSDMTEEEEVERGKVILSARDEGLSEMAEVVRWLLSNHFDIFNLIESGLAIDKTTLK